MGFSWIVARRYLFAKKSHTAINLISGISMVGVAIGTMALVVVMSVFNGFDVLVQSLFNAFDPDLKITAVEGKVFISDSLKRQEILRTEGVLFLSEVLEENAMLKYRDKQNVATIKGVDKFYYQVTGIDSLLDEGLVKPDTDIFHYAIVGRGVASNLEIGTLLYDPLFVYIVKRSAEINFNPEEVFRSRYVYPTAVFSIDQDVDSKYVIAELNFLRQMLDYKNEVSAWEIRLKEDADKKTVQKTIASLMGKDFYVKNNIEQQELFYKIMKAEKWAIFFILAFIIIVASLNIISTLTMLIIDKKKDIVTFSHIGANWSQIRRIFFTEGWLISGMGAGIGLIAGLAVCLIQMHFKIVKLQGSGTFIIDHYPVIVKPADIVAIFLTVFIIGVFTSWVPSRIIRAKKF